MRSGGGRPYGGPDLGDRPVEFSDRSLDAEDLFGCAAEAVGGLEAPAGGVDALDDAVVEVGNLLIRSRRPTLPVAAG